MQIGKILFPVTTLGPGERLGIWVVGCNRFCRGCANPELQTFDETKDIPVDQIFKATKRLRFNGITISGGEPFLQAEDLCELVEGFRERGYGDILVYTGFTLQELNEQNNSFVDRILSQIAVLIDGPFEKDLVDDVPLRGSSNQNVWIFNSEYRAAYEAILSQEKKIDIFQFDDEVHFIGIPFEGFDRLYKKYLGNGKRE